MIQPCYAPANIFSLVFSKNFEIFSGPPGPVRLNGKKEERRRKIKQVIVLFVHSLLSAKYIFFSIFQEPITLKGNTILYRSLFKQ